MTRRLLVLLTALVLAAGLGSAPAWAGPGDNDAVAINLKDGTSIFRFAFSIRKTMSEVVDETNVAVAYSSCDDCRTVALAVQVVLVTSDPDVVTPENVAVAVNYACTSCETFASAYQFVLSTGGPVKFTGAGNKALADIRRELRELLRSELPFDELQARIDALMDRLRQVLATELVPAGKGDKPKPPHENEPPSDTSGSTDTGTEPTETETTPTETESTPTDTTETDTAETDTAETDTTETETTSTTTEP